MWNFWLNFEFQSKASVGSSIEGVAKMLETDLATQKAKILQTLVEVVTTLPEKCSVYSTLAGLLNAKNYNFGGEVSYLKLMYKILKSEYLPMIDYQLINC